MGAANMGDVVLFCNKKLRAYVKTIFTKYLKISVS
jgi:hypothetical protein